MKRTIKILSLVLAVVLLSGCSLFKSENTKNYELMVQAVNEKQYDLAVETYRNSELFEHEDKFPDAEKYYIYAQAMQSYKKGFWTATKNSLETSCKGFLDSDKIVEEISKTFKKYEGTYKNTSVIFDMYIFIKDGRVDECMDKADISTPKYYSYALRDYTFTNGDHAIGLGLEKEDPDYILFGSPDEGKKLVLTKFETAKYDTFKGVYVKISDSTPPKKN